MSKKIKQGQTKWKVVIYEPGKIEGYDNEYVACIYRCFITKVENKTIYYTCGNDGYYLCSKEFWKNKLECTFREAIQKARRNVSRELLTCNQ